MLLIQRLGCLRRFKLSIPFQFTDFQKKADVHSQQRFFYMGHKGEYTIDQAHRGYTECTDAKGFLSLNPLYMKYTKDSAGNFLHNCIFLNKLFFFFGKDDFLVKMDMDM